MADQEQGQMPEGIKQWVRTHPDEVADYVTNPETRRGLVDSLRADPDTHGLSQEDVQWIEDRLGDSGYPSTDPTVLT